MNKQILHHRDENIFTRKENIRTLTEAAGLLSMISLWPNADLPAKEMITLKEAIRRFLLSAEDPYKQYIAFCERMLMNLQPPSRQPGKKLRPMPSVWLQDNNDLLCDAPNDPWLPENTRHLFQRRKNRALAEAVLEMLEAPSEDIFNYWINWFRIRKAADELVFSPLLVFLQFIRKPAATNRERRCGCCHPQLKGGTGSHY